MPVDTHHKILDVARRLFIQQGYTATSMRQVAEAAGIGKATIYHHFPDKTALVMALLEGVQERMDKALEAVRAETDPRGRIEVAARTSIGFLYESADILQITRREVPQVRDLMRKDFPQFYREYLKLLAEAIRRGTREGIYRDTDPDAAARVLMTMIQGTFASAYIAGERFRSPEKASEILLDIFFRGIDAH